MPTTTVCSCGYEKRGGDKTIVVHHRQRRMRDVHVHDGLTVIPAPSLVVHYLRRLAAWVLRCTEPHFVPEDFARTWGT